MTDTTSVHSLDAQARMFYPEGKAPWREATPPDLSAGRTMGSMRSCQFCGSMHPADLAAAIRAGARGSFADMKYGWPHKAYFDGVPNPHAGLLETRSSSSTKSEWFPHEVREPRYNERTGERIADYVTYTEAPTPAPATTHGKFYTLHLQDATPEDRDTIERHLGLRFEFDGHGVGWKSVSLNPVPSTDTAPACDSKALDLNDDTPLAPACDLSGDGTCEACQ